MSFLEAYEEFKIYASKRHKKQGFDTITNDFNLHILPYVKKHGYGKDYFIFGGLKPLSTTTIDRVKHRACIKKNIREITQHQFRHSYATYLIHKGVPIDYVSKTMGHNKGIEPIVK